MQNNKGWISQLSIVLTGQIFSLMGSGIVQFAIIWWITFNFKSASALATATIMGVLPVILFSPFAGVVADKYNRKLVMIVADAFTALVTFVFFLIVLGNPDSTDVFSKEMIYVLLFLRAIGSAFHQPAFESSMPLIIPKDHLVRGAAITQMLRSGINMVAPMLGAVLFGVMGLKYILMIDVVTAIIAIFSLTLIQLPDLGRQDQSPSTLHGYMSDLKLGLKYIYNWKGLLALIIVFAMANFLLAPMLALISKVIYLYFSTDSSDFAFFEMALSIGLILGSLSLSVWGGTRRKIVIVNVAQVLCGLFIASIAGIAAISSELFGLVQIGRAHV